MSRHLAARASARLVAGLACLALLASSRSAEAASGSDLGTGYRWIDSASGATAGPGFFDGPVTTLQPADDTVPGPAVDMGFGPAGFPFYGTNYTHCFISDNGWLSFLDPGDAFPTPPADILTPGAPEAVIAPFWTDLLCDSSAAGRNVRYGRVNSQGAFRIQWSAQIIATGEQIIFDAYLFSDGRIKFHYLLGRAIGPATIGLENETGTDGIEISGGGVQATGVPATITSNYAIDFIPPPLLIALCPSIPEITCGSLTDSLPDTLPGNIQQYGCGAATANANEKVYSFNLTEPSAVDITLTAGTARNLRLYLLNACDETRCLRGGTGLTMSQVLLGTGRYYIVVEAGAVADEGTYTLDLACQPLAAPFTCGDVIPGDTSSLTNRLASSPCAPVGRGLTGPEQWHWLQLASATNLRATLTGLVSDLDVLIFRATPQQEITSADCIGWGDDAAVAWDAAPDDYLIVVDGVAGAQDRYTLETSCGIEADCTSIAGRIDFSAARRHVVADDTTSGINNAEIYRCDPATVMNGTELVFELELPAPGQIAIRQIGGVAGLSYFVLDSCNEGSCLGIASEGIGCGSQLAAGTHYLVVDGASGAAGPFEVEVVYEEAFNRWTVCQDPGGGTDPDDTSRTEWNFQDDWYCHSDPASRNYPDGCTFAMYVTAACGTELHLPLYDVEGGHVRIFDVFRGEYMRLTAESTGGWFAEGDDIQWEDCPGTDPLWNNQTTDIWMRRDEGLCGIFRLEFVKHSGNVWELFANCQGTNTPQFQIHDSLCGALADYEPLPNISLITVTPVYNCPDISITYELRNDGCKPASDIEVTLWDADVEVASQVIPFLGAGETMTLLMDARFAAGDTNGVKLTVDAGDSILECIEAEGAACEVQAGDDEAILPDCSTTCRVTAAADVTPTRACEGDATIIDASASVSVNCPGGLLEYQLTGPDGTIPWQASPVFSLPAEGVTSDYTVEARCADPGFQATCFDDTVVNQPSEQRPLFDPASVVATDPCDAGIVLSWAPATWRGAAGAGYYNVYRSEISCLDAVTTPGNLLASGLLGVTSYPDDSAIGGTTYYYVVEAEDGTGNTACVPAGPTVRGAVTRVDVQAGTCVGITDGRGAGDPASLPRVQTSLRLGGGDPRQYGPDFVRLQWTTDVPLDVTGGEHFHVLRADDPSLFANFARINPEPPRLTVGDFTDTAAAQPGRGTDVLYYLVLTADGCEVDNRDHDLYRSQP